MALKITIEVDGQTEQQIAPVLGKALARHGHLLAGNSAPPAAQPEVRHENAAVLQQTIQQLMAQNQRLQNAYEQKLMAGAPTQRALPAAVERTDSRQQQIYQSSPASAVKAEVVPPSLPVKYRPNRAQIILHRLSRSAIASRQTLWRMLVWLTFGKEWLTLLILLSGITYGIVAFAPKLWAPPEFVEKTDALPGEAKESEGQPQQSTQFDDQPDESSEESPPAATPTPASKAGSHPPPPPAFQP